MENVKFIMTGIALLALFTVFCLFVTGCGTVRFVPEDVRIGADVAHQGMQQLADRMNELPTTEKDKALVNDLVVLTGATARVIGDETPNAGELAADPNKRRERAEKANAAAESPFTAIAIDYGVPGWFWAGLGTLGGLLGLWFGRGWIGKAGSWGLSLLRRFGLAKRAMKVLVALKSDKNVGAVAREILNESDKAELAKAGADVSKDRGI